MGSMIGCTYVSPATLTVTLRVATKHLPTTYTCYTLYLAVYVYICRLFENIVACLLYIVPRIYGDGMANIGAMAQRTENIGRRLSPHKSTVLVCFKQN